MAKKTAPLLPPTAELLRQFGDRLRVARLRRRLSAKQASERAGMSPMTLRSLERGGSGVTAGAYLAVMQVLGVESDLALLAQSDPVGRAVQDARLPSRTKTAQTSASPQPAPPSAQVSTPRVRRKPVAAPQGWIAKSGFASSEALAGLIDPKPPLSKKRR